MFNPELLDSLIESQTHKIEYARKQAKELLELLQGSSIALQMDESTLNAAVISSVLQDKISFRERITSLGYSTKAYFLALKKFAVRKGIESTDIDLTPSKRELLVEEYISSHPEDEQEIISIAAELDEQ